MWVLTLYFSLFHRRKRHHQKCSSAAGEIKLDQNKGQKRGPWWHHGVFSLLILSATECSMQDLGSTHHTLIHTCNQHQSGSFLISTFNHLFSWPPWSHHWLGKNRSYWPQLFKNRWVFWGFFVGLRGQWMTYFLNKFSHPLWNNQNNTVLDVNRFIL